MSYRMQPSAPSNSFEPFYAPIREELQRVEALLSGSIANTAGFLRRVLDHSSRLSGKRLRPALLLMFAQMTGGVSPHHRVLAAALETIHTATLVHDDILDEATTRRHLPTVNAQWNNETSVLLGDYMMAQAMREVVNLDLPAASHLLVETTCRLCEGEMLQVGHCGNFDLTEEEYYRIIAGKTASLCECACRLGALTQRGEEPDCAELAVGFGRQLGLAFQIADDLLDLLGDEAQMGKTLGSDLVKQKLTLPMIRLLRELPDPEREALIDRIRQNPGDGVCVEIREKIRSHGVLKSVRTTAEEHIRTAVASLQAFPAGPERTSLAALAAFIVERRQ